MTVLGLDEGYLLAAAIHSYEQALTKRGITILLFRNLTSVENTYSDAHGDIHLSK